jgi:hypothetical protein
MLKFGYILESNIEMQFFIDYCMLYLFLVSFSVIMPIHNLADVSVAVMLALFTSMVKMQIFCLLLAGTKSQNFFMCECQNS